jgi:glutamate/tyrosine decarboxylase-like PLP-dependent enzyme
MMRPMSKRIAPLEMSPREFRAAGHRLVDRIAEFLGSIPNRPVTLAETPPEIRSLLGGGGLPERGKDAGALLDRASDLLFEHSLLNGHPGFLAYITSSAAPIGALADLLAAAVNPNLGAFSLAPVATEIEAQTVRWIAELIGYPGDGGILVSGGNMANFVGFLAARRAKDEEVRVRGIDPARARLRVYASAETHTWLQKAADLFGLGTDALRWIPVDAGLRMDPAALEAAIIDDERRGDSPFLAVGTAGSVGTGAVDPLPEIAAIARRHGLWFHVDGAYGGFAAALPDAPGDLKALALADSVAVDPHKWLYAPLEAGCALVKSRAVLRDTFGYRPPYYHLERDDDTINFYELGLQNSRGFRALKVWLGLLQAGRQGAVRMMEDDIALAGDLARAVERTPGLELLTVGLSIVTFRFVPSAALGTPALNALNEKLLTAVQEDGRCYMSNAVVDGKFALRACIVNFRTTRKDVEAIPGIVVELGRRMMAGSRPGTNAAPSVSGRRRVSMAKYGKTASEKVERAMHEKKKGKLKSGRSGRKVTSRKQAIAIGLSEARKAGGKVPKKKSSTSSSKKK